VEELDFVVVGTGFSALSACMYLVENGIKPVVIDSDSKQSKDYLNRFVKPNFKRPLGLKNQFKSPYVYSYPKSKILKRNVDQLFGPTFSTGGYSEVWGGVVDDSTVLLESFLNIKGKEIDEVLNFIKQWFTFHEIDKKDKNYKYFAEMISYHKNIEIKSGQFAGNLSINLRNSNTNSEKDLYVNFRTSEIFDHLIDKKLIEIRKGFLLEKIEKDFDGKTILNFKHDKSMSKIKATNLYLATGVASTAQILLASNLIETAIIKDSQLILIPILKFRNSFDKNLEAQNSSHPIFIMKSINEKVGTFYAQVYKLELEMLKRFSNTKFKFVLNLLTTLILKYVGVIFCYLNEVNSSPLIMSYDGKEYMMDTDKNHFDKKGFIKDFRKYNRALNKIGFIPFVRLMRVMNPGDGFHTGHLQGVHSGSSVEAEIVDTNGKLKGFNKTYLVDGSSLNFISAGPITLAIMINSISIVKKSLSNLNLANLDRNN
jgi:hypothetical protein